MKTAADLSLLVQQKTWGKELVLWVGSENRLRELLGDAAVVNLDLLDLFDPDRLPMDDDDTRTELQKQLRQRLQNLPAAPGSRTILVIRSVGLLARYQVGVGDFYQWFCNDFAMAILVLGNLPAEAVGSDEVTCVPDRLTHYFRPREVVTEVYGEVG